MGWMRTLLLGDIGNRLDIADAENDIRALRDKQRHSVQALAAKQGELEKLKGELGRQKLAIQALTRFLIEKQVIDNDQLHEFIRLVDAEDGVIDGKMEIDPNTGRLHFPELNAADSPFKKG